MVGDIFFFWIGWSAVLAFKGRKYKWGGDEEVLFRWLIMKRRGEDAVDGSLFIQLPDLACSL